MIGMYAEHSGTLLQILSILTGVLFSVPILFAPLAWARLLRWEVEEKSDLALYFGRSLGALALTLSGAAWYAAQHRELQPFFFAMLIAIFSLMVVVHVVGALQKVQPWTETAEIPFWLGLAVLGFLFYPAG